MSDLRGRRFAVVGGGLSGLAAAWYLQGRGADTHIFERDPELGGRARSGLLSERVLTLGGKNIGQSYARFRAFAATLGNQRYEHFGINTSRVIDGRTVTFDSEDPAGMLRNLRGVSARDLTRLAELLLRLRREPSACFLSEAHCRRLARRYGSASVQDVFGERVRELMLRSLTVRVSAAEPDEVPMCNILPYLRMLTDTYEQLADGMGGVVSAAAKRFRVSVGTNVEALLGGERRVRGVEVSNRFGERRVESFDGVVLATHAGAAAKLLDPVLPLAANLLRGVRYFPLAVLLVEYERPVFDSRVRALAFGPGEPVSNAGAYGTGDLDVVRYTFSGRRARMLVREEPDAERLAAVAERALAPHAHITGNPRREMLAHRFPAGLCAYHPDQAGFLERIGPTRAKVEGLYLTGDYMCGCSIEACFAAAEQAIAAV